MVGVGSDQVATVRMGALSQRTDGVDKMLTTQTPQLPVSTLSTVFSNLFRDVRR